ncbi:MAG TPA: DtxR family transcriptional regulator [Firmicutes bacterium]|nr:DtxR family transcriptional regulator [Bacillota bacterium]
MNQTFRTFRGFEQLRLLEESLSPSLEDYLEMIFRKTRYEETMRNTDLAEELNVSVASATKNVQRLSCLGFIIYEPYGKLKLTKLGEATGQFLYNRHEIIERFFQVLGSLESGFVETEMIEHYLSQSTVERLELLTHFLEKYHQEWINFSAE